MKSSPIVKLVQIGVGSNIAQITRLASKKSYMVITAPNSHEKFTKYEIRYSHYSPQFVFVYHNLAQYTICDNLTIFSLTYPYLQLFSIVCLYSPPV